MRSNIDKQSLMPLGIELFVSLEINNFAHDYEKNE